MDINLLKPYAQNARTHSDEQIKQIAASIKEFGFTNPILIDGDNNIIAGHGRIAAAQLLGLTDVPVVVLSHLTDAQKRAYIIADNKLALNAGWDMDLLKAEVDCLVGENFDLSLMGFSKEEIDALLAKVGEAELPELPTTDRPEFAQMTFTLHRDQVAEVEAAIEEAKAMGDFIDTGNENSNGNALARICETFRTQNGAS